MDNKLEQAIDRLVGRGFSYLPVDEVLVEEASDAYRELINKLSQLEEEGLNFCQHRSGEDEVDIGLIFRSGGGGKDLKYFFHFANDLDWEPFLKYKEHLLILERMYKAINALAYTLSVGLRNKYSEHFPEYLPQLVDMAAGNANPYNTTTLRCLYYPEAPGQSGAKLHIDRSFLTFHLGDRGGKLLAREGESLEDETVVSPNAAEALVFFGVKVIYPTQGRLQPLWHRSITEGGDRSAMVQFVHADVGVKVVTAADNFHDYFKPEA